MRLTNIAADKQTAAGETRNRDVRGRDEKKRDCKGVDEIPERGSKFRRRGDIFTVHDIRRICPPPACHPSPAPFPMHRRDEIARGSARVRLVKKNAAVSQLEVSGAFLRFLFPLSPPFETDPRFVAGQPSKSPRVLVEKGTQLVRFEQERRIAGVGGGLVEWG